MIINNFGDKTVYEKVKFITLTEHRNNLIDEILK